MAQQQEGDWGWGSLEEEFPDSSKIAEWEYYASSKEDGSDSGVISTRIPESLLIQIDEMLVELRALGIPLKSKGDFARFAIVRGYRQLQEVIGLQKEGRAHFMLLLRNTLQATYRTKLLSESRSTVKDFTKGIRVLVEFGELKEGLERTVEFLKPLMEMTDQHEVLTRIYIRELFRDKEIKNLIEKCGVKSLQIPPTITNAKTVFDRLENTS